VITHWTPISQTVNQPGGTVYSYVPENVHKIPGGGISFVGNQIGGNPLQWNTGMVVSDYSFLYGYAEARMKLQAGKGIDSAFFLFNQAQEEIDFELVSEDPNKILLSIHSAGNLTYDQIESTLDFDLSADYHLYGIEWTYKYVRWYIDRKLKYEQIFHIPKQALNLYFGIAAGGMATPDGTSPMTVTQYVDWAKVWRRSI
jgi:beta-glucanase (GH16 family)